MTNYNISSNCSSVSQSSWEDTSEDISQPPIAPYIPPFQYDSMSSASDEDYSIAEIHRTKNVPVNRASGNAVFKDTISSCQNDELYISQVRPNSQVFSNTTSQSDSISENDDVLDGIMSFDEAQQLVKENYDESLSKADPETQAIITNIDSQTQVNGKLLTFEQKMQQLSQAINNELGKENINFESLQAMVLKMVMMHMRKTARLDHEYTSDLGVQIKIQAKIVQDSYTSWKTLTFTLVTTGITGGLAVFGLAPIVTDSLVTAATASNCMQASTALSNTLSGLNLLMQGKDNSIKQHHEFVLRLKQSSEESGKDRKRSSGELQKRASEHDRAHEESRHQTTQSMVQTH